MRKAISKYLQSEIVMYLVIGLIGIAVYVALYGYYILNPAYVDWLLEKGDLTQHYLGWLAYNKSDWLFPIGNESILGYPNEVSVIFTDSIPIVALIGKLILHGCSGNYQFFGIYGIICFVLQGEMAAVLMKKYIASRWNIIIGSTFFMIAPIMIYRVYYHTSLSAQWLILLAFVPIFYYKEKYHTVKNSMIIWTVLGALTAGIHLYFTLMCGFVLLAYAVKVILEDYDYKLVISSMSCYVVAAGFITGIFGGFSSGVKTNNVGLGKYNFNLNELINPAGYSYFFKDLPLYGNGQDEGFAYLGTGIIVICGIVLIDFVIHWKERIAYLSTKKKSIAAYGLIIFCSMAFSIANVLSIGDYLIIKVVLPTKIKDTWSIFRATGRMIWPVVYIAMLFAIIAFTKVLKKTNWTSVILVCILLFQIYDMKEVIIEKRQTFNKKVVYESQLTDTIWEVMGNMSEIKHICYGSEFSYDEMCIVAEYALSTNKTTNNFYFSRKMHTDSMEDAVSMGEQDTIFLFKPEDIDMLDDLNLQHYETADGIIVGYRKNVADLF